MRIKVIKIIALLALFTSAIYIGSTSSYFQDTEKVENNVFSVGTMELNLNKEGGGEASTVWTAENWLPGDEVEGEIEFENTGSMPVESLLVNVEIE